MNEIWARHRYAYMNKRQENALTDET